MYFDYGAREVDYLKARDRVLGEVIDQVGHVEREVDPDLFSAVVHHIVGQQISTKAQATIWARMRERLGEVNARTVAAAGTAALQSVGISLRKAEYIQDFAGKVNSGAFDLQRVAALPDSDIDAAAAALARAWRG